MVTPAYNSIVRTNLATASPLAQVVALANAKGVLRPRDLAEAGLSRDYLWRLHRSGALERLERGIYALPTKDATENRGLMMAATRVPKGVVCLLSALRFHGITTQSPHEVWLAVERGSRLPRGGYPPIRPFAFAPAVFNAGIEERPVEGSIVRVYSPAKTVADCFRYRNKIGPDVALEALRECWRQRLASIEDIYRYAGICRVANVIRPYLESLL